MVSMNHIGATIYVPTSEEIYMSLADDPSAELLRTFTMDDTGVDATNISKTIYLPASYVGMFLYRDLLPTESW